MKVNNYLIGTLIAVLLMISTANAQSPMGPGDHMMEGTSHMDVEGTIVVEDAIILMLTVQPNDDMQERMEGRSSSMSPLDYTNEIIVRFTSMVEFEDMTGDGYTSDDFTVGSYILDDTTLSQPVLIDNTYYTISSLDGTTFTMAIDLSFEDNVFYGFKWSLNIEYPFVSTTSDLALIHEVDTIGGHMTDRNMMQNSKQEQVNYRINETEMRDDNDHLPMFFSWVTEVTVDNVNETIIATVISDDIAISMPQGEHIYYDPGMGVDADALQNVDNELADLGSFLDSIMSPTNIGLFLGLVALISFGIYARSVKKASI